MRGIVRSLLVSLWFMALTFPLLVIKISPLNGEVIWRFANALYLGLGVFFLSFVWRALLVVKGITTAKEADLEWLFAFLADDKNRARASGAALLAAGAASLAAAFSTMQINASSAGGLLAAALFALLCLRASFLCFTGRGAELKRSCNAASQAATRPGLVRTAVLGVLLLGLIPLPFFIDMYQVNVLASAFIWIMLGLGLNIVVGQAGLLVLGYVAFYAVGAYSYAICNANFGGEFIGFWVLLPFGGFLAAVAGILLSLPVLRLRGDYLAIVTLGFGEIVRIILEGGSLSLAPVASLISLFTDAPLPAWLTAPLNLGGPAGISDIPYPSFFGLKFDMDASIRYIYFIALGMTCLTIFVVTRLRDSRLGRSWMALREDEIACEAMGINKVATKLSAFALGACWAGFGGVLFAAKTSFINPSSFTFMESALILSVVVLGGLGSIVGVALGACILIILPEYLRSFDEYRMLIFGACMVLMMVFRPQGLIAPQKKRRIIKGVNDPETLRQGEAS